MPNISTELARFAIETKWEDLPENVVRGTKLLLLDSLGCALAGIATDPGKMAIALAKRLGGPLESSIIGIGGKVSCVNAAMANGQLINAIDYEALSGHAPPYLVPPPLAMGESLDVSGRELILALAVGLEISSRVGSALSRGSFMTKQDGGINWAARSGYANTNFGSAAAVGKLMGLDENKMVHALGIAGHLTQVLTWIRYTFQDHRAMTKYGVPGWQNTGAVTAALLAEMGYLGDTTVFDDKEGFWKFAGYETWQPDKVLAGLGQNWNFFQKILFKPYPCCRMFQTELEVFLKIIEEQGLRPEEIESIRIFGHPTLEAPAFTNREINSVADVQFNPAYTFAMAAQGVPKGADWQDLERVRSPATAALAAKTTYQTYPDFGKTQVSLVEVVARGQTFKGEKPFIQLHEMTEEELVEKYRHNASIILTRPKIDASVDRLVNLEKLPHLSELMSAVTL